MTSGSMALSPSSDVASPRRISPWIITPVVSLAAFMEVLDTTIVNSALPHIAGSLAQSVDDTTWILTTYLVANAIFLPLNGYLSAWFGRKRYFMSCLVIFTLSSFMCGIAPNFAALLIFRIIQGLGGGGLQPGTQAILTDAFPREKGGLAQAMFGMVVVFGPIAGPLLGGYLTDNYSWRWCFLVNVPVGLLAILLVFILVSEPAHQRRLTKAEKRNIDYTGLGFMALGLAALQIMVDRGEDLDWFGSRFIVICAIVAVLGIAATVAWEWYNDHPIVDLHLLRERNLALATVGMFFLGVIFYGSTVLLPLLGQTQMGYTATQGGWLIAPAGMVVLVLMPITGGLITKVSTRWLIFTGVAFNVVGLMMMGQLSLHADFDTLVWDRIIQAAGLPMIFLPFNAAAFAYVERSHTSDASGIINLARNIGGSIGISLTTAYIANQSQVHQNYLVGNITPLNPAAQATLHRMQTALGYGPAGPIYLLRSAESHIYAILDLQTHMLGYIDAFHLLAVSCLCIAPIAFYVKSVTSRAVLATAVARKRGVA